MPKNRGTSRKGKPKKDDRMAGMGRALQKAQQRKRRPQRSNGSLATGSKHLGGMASSGAGNIGIENDNDGGEVGMQSMLQVDELTDFLQQASMASREFTVEKEQFVVLDDVAGSVSQRGVRWLDENEEDENNMRGQDPSQLKFQELAVPRRPKWDTSTTPAQLQEMENEAFLEWRRGIARQEEALYQAHIQSEAQHQSLSNAPTVTPFEKNLQVWKQLWRVLERSSCLVLIVDARNPLFYYSKDLKAYCDELHKPMVLLLNKSDYLTPKQRQAWRNYFTNVEPLEHYFFSAHEEQTRLEQPSSSAHHDDNYQQQEQQLQEEPWRHMELAPDHGVTHLLTRTQLQNHLLHYASTQNCLRDARYHNRYQFGTVGFPNVGKSSVINVLTGSSKSNAHVQTRVGVASQPGKTKHFQTVLLGDNDDMMLCDCPGLVFPSWVYSTAELYAAGVLPLSQMRCGPDVVNVIRRRIPRKVLEGCYGMKLPLPSVLDLQEMGWTMEEAQHALEFALHGKRTASDDGGDGNVRRLPLISVEELLDTFCVARSKYKAGSGAPDHAVASRMMVKDYVDGKLLYCHPPPSSSSADANGAREDERAVAAQKQEEFLRETVVHALQREEKIRKRVEALTGVTTTTTTTTGGQTGGDVYDAVETPMLSSLSSDVMASC